MKIFPEVKMKRGEQESFILRRKWSYRLSVREMYIYEQHHAGCRFITVDAYRSSLDFYEKNRFKYLTTKDKDEDTRAIYFDLKAV
jgi:hypothetical protein